MFLKELVKNLFPHDKVFFQLFEKVGVNIENIGQLLDDMISEANPDKRAQIALSVGDIEHANDDLTHQIFTELNQNFITPFDREDIHYLTTALDDIADYVHACSKKIILYKVNPNDSYMQKFAELIKLSCSEVKIIVDELKNMKKSSAISEALVRINSIENQADDVYDLGVENLFEHENDIKLLIKKREIYQLMEIVTDKCEDVSNVIETILIKYA